jgi:hypothetical protein
MRRGPTRLRTHAKSFAANGTDRMGTPRSPSVRLAALKRSVPSAVDKGYVHDQPLGLVLDTLLLTARGIAA